MLIGNSAYPKETGWSNLNSHNDLVLLEEALVEKGVLAENIIKGENLKKATLLLFIDSLVNACKEGDQVLFHFSGHGQRVIDLNGDEIDGLDESIVPIDAYKEIKRNGHATKYNADNHIIDDELNQLLNLVRKKIGPKGALLVSLDSCFSGSATRGENSIRRGSDKIFGLALNEQGLDSYKQKNNIKNSNFLDLKANKALSPIAIFHAAQSFTPNWEFYFRPESKYYGPLSFSIASCLAELNRSISTEQLFNGILIEMAKISSDQLPCFEGNKDIVLFGKRSNKRNKIYITRLINDTLIEISKGALSNFFPGTTLIFESKNNQFSGEIIKSELNKAQVRIDFQNIDSKSIFTYEGKVVEQNFGLAKIGIALEVSNHQLKEDIASKIERNSLLNVKDQQYHIKIKEVDEVLELHDYKDLYLTSFKFSELDKLFHFLDRYSNAENLKKINGGNPILNLELIFILNGEQQVTSPLEILSGDTLAFEIKNNSHERLFFNLFLIGIKNNVEFFFPANPGNTVSHSVSELNIPPFEKLTLDDTFKFSNDFGYDYLELIVLYVSTEEFDLRSDVLTRGFSSNKTITKFIKPSSDEQISSINIEHQNLNIYQFPILNRAR